MTVTDSRSRNKEFCLDLIFLLFSVLSSRLLFSYILLSTHVVRTVPGQPAIAVGNQRAL